MLLSVNVFSVNVMFCSLDEMQRIFQERKKKVAYSKIILCRHNQ